MNAYFGEATYFQSQRVNYDTGRNRSSNGQKMCAAFRLNGKPRIEVSKSARGITIVRLIIKPISRILSACVSLFSVRIRKLQWVVCDIGEQIYVAATKPNRIFRHESTQVCVVPTCPIVIKP